MDTLQVLVNQTKYCMGNILIRSLLVYSCESVTTGQRSAGQQHDFFNTNSDIAGPHLPILVSFSGLLSGPPPPTDVTAVQDGPTTITVTWTPPSPLGDTTGYRISFTGGSDVDIDGGSTNSYTLTGLSNGQIYTISIVATSSGLSNAPEQATVALGMSKH